MAYQLINQPDPHHHGRSQKITTVIVHWWGLPGQTGNLQQTANYLYNSELSVHYVASDKTVIKMVEENQVAYHAASANPFSVGIECDPRMPGSSYATVEELVADICTRHGLDPRVAVQPHNRYFNTQCPGTVDWRGIGIAAYNIMQSGGNVSDIATRLNELQNAVKFRDEIIAKERAEAKLHIAHRDRIIDELRKDVAKLMDENTKLKAELGKKVDADPDAIVVTKKGWSALWDAIKSFFNTNN